MNFNGKYLIKITLVKYLVTNLAARLAVKRALVIS